MKCLTLGRKKKKPSHETQSQLKMPLPSKKDNKLSKCLKVELEESCCVCGLDGSGMRGVKCLGWQKKK